MPRGPEIPLTIRHVAIAYFFDLGMRQTDICERLGISKQSLSVLISRTKERCPTYSDPENAGPTPEELNMLCTAAAVKQRSGRPRRADGGGRCSHCGAPRLRTKKARKKAAEFNAAAAAAAVAEGGGGGEAAAGDATDAVDGESDDDNDDDDDADADADGAGATSATWPVSTASANDGAGGEASSGGGGTITLPPITASAAPAPTPAPAVASTAAYPATSPAYPPGSMAVPGVSMVNGIVSQGGGNWFYGHNGWEMYGRRDVGGGGNPQQGPNGQNGDFNRQY